MLSSGELYWNLSRSPRHSTVDCGEMRRQSSSRCSKQARVNVRHTKSGDNAMKHNNKEPDFFSCFTFCFNLVSGCLIVFCSFFSCLLRRLWRSTVYVRCFVIFFLLCSSSVWVRCFLWVKRLVNCNRKIAALIFFSASRLAFGCLDGLRLSATVDDSKWTEIVECGAGDFIRWRDGELLKQ